MFRGRTLVHNDTPESRFPCERKIKTTVKGAVFSVFLPVYRNCLFGTMATLSRWLQIRFDFHADN